MLVTGVSEITGSSSISLPDSVYTHEHVLQRVLGQPAIEEHRYEEVSHRWIEKLKQRSR